MMVFKRKQIVVLSLVLMIIVAGYLQYSYRRSSIPTSGDAEGKLGDSVYVDSNGNVSENTGDIAANSKDAKNTKDTAASKEANAYFAQAKIDKEATLSKDKETLQQITEDTNASKEIKSEAYDRMMAIVKNSQREINIETLIKKIGFADTLVLFGEDGSIDVVIKTPSLSPSQVVQVTDIVSRQAKTDIEKIHIKSIY